MRKNYGKKSSKRQVKATSVKTNTEVKVKVVPSNNSNQSYSSSVPPNPYRIQRTI